MIRVVINGILGRMGEALTRVLSKEEDFFLVGGVDTLETFYNEEIVVSTNPEDVLMDVDVVVDFSSGEGCAAIADACREKGIPLVTGTTGLTDEEQQKINQLAEIVPVVQAFNFSIGINLLNNVIQQAASILKDNYDIEIVEIHHRYKKDAPSGTARMFANTLAEIQGLTDEEIRFGRSGNNLSRGDEITIHSLRGGSIIGEHQIHFFCKNEHLSFIHHSLSRRVFVDGALRAIEWVVTQKPGLYSMNDVLSIES